jgi:hypothetical protein
MEENVLNVETLVGLVPESSPHANKPITAMSTTKKQLGFSILSLGES